MSPQINALVVPVDSGVRGVRLGAGPALLVKSGIFEDLRRPVAIAEFAPAGPEPHGEIASAFASARWLAQHVSAARADGAFPIVLAGNCMAAVGVFAGLRSRSRRVPGVCWFDAHGDYNTPETSTSGFLDGMALATLTGRCWTALTDTISDFRPAPEESVLLFGTRDLDRAERAALQASAIQWPKRQSDNALDDEQLAELRTRFGEVYLHIDFDVLDVSEARANQFSCPGGLTRAQLVDLVRTIGASFHIGAASFTAYDPSFDARNAIPSIARELVEVIVNSLA